MRQNHVYRSKFILALLSAFLLLLLSLWLYTRASGHAGKRDFVPDTVADYLYRQNASVVYHTADSLKYQIEYMAAAQLFGQILAGSNHSTENRYYGVNQLTWLYLMMGKDSMAIQWIQQLSDSTSVLAGNAGADYRFNTGLLAFHAGDWQNALFQFRKAAAGFADLYGNDHLRYAQCMNQIGLVYISQSDNPEAAKEYIHEASQFFDHHPELEYFRIENYLAKALIAVIDRDYKRGTYLCDLALKQFSTLPYQNKLLKAKILCVKGDHMKHLQLTTESDAILKDALQLVREDGYSFEAGDLFRITAFLLTDLSDTLPQYPEGLDRFFQNARLQRGYPDWVKGFAWYYKGQVDSSVYYLERFLQNNIATDARTMDAVYYVLCEIYATRKNYKKSLDFANKDLQIGTDSSHLNFVVYGLIGRVYLEKYRHSKQTSDLLQAELNFARVDSLFFPSMLAFSEEAILGFQQQVGDDCFPQAVETTYLLYQKTGATKWLDKAFRYGERQKSMLMYRDMLNRHTIQDASYFIWADSVRKVTARINRLQFMKDNQRNWSAVSQHELERALSNLEQVNRNRRRTSEEYNRTIRQPISTIAEVQAALEEKEVVLTYCFGINELYGMCITKQGKTGFFRVGNSGELKSRLNRFHSALQHYQTDLAPACDTLSTQLLLSFEPFLKGKEEILVIPDRELYLVPFEVFYWQKKPTLPSGNNLRHLLVDDFAIAYTPSWKVHLAHRREAKQLLQPKNIGIWADASLSNRSTCTNAIFQAFGTKSAIDTFSGRLCTKNTFLSRQKNYDILHLFMHGKSNLSDRRDNKLSFGAAQDTLWGFEVQAEDFSTRLLVLSACETALGTHETGEGAFTLSRSFLQAGVSQVVATLWEVQEEKTALILASFYQNLGQNVMPTKALQQAKCAYKNKVQGFWKHPAFWAGAVVME